MGGGLKLSKDKRHRSSSSLGGTTIEGTRSERKLDIRASIPEVEDHFAVADARCNNLQEKIDLIKVLKRKNKLKKRSMTRVLDHSTDSVPFIKVVTQPKKKVSAQATRHHRLELPPARRYTDPAAVEQEQMLGIVRQHYRDANISKIPDPEMFSKIFKKRTRADGDRNAAADSGPVLTRPKIEVPKKSPSPTRKTLKVTDADSTSTQEGGSLKIKNSLEIPKRDLRKKSPSPIKRTVPIITVTDVDSSSSSKQGVVFYNQSKLSPKRASPMKSPILTQRVVVPKRITEECIKEERSLVELFNKNRTPSPVQQGTEQRSHDEPRAKDKNNFKLYNVKDENESNNIENLFEETSCPCLGESSSARAPKSKGFRVLKRRCCRYEQPTIASKLKQSALYTHEEEGKLQVPIPFVGAGSTSPSFNLGANIQEMLFGICNRQPILKIPLTIAHRMGLDHMPTTSQSRPDLDREINALKLSGKKIFLFRNKKVSYKKLIKIISKDNGMIARFLRTANRSNVLYTSLYNLETLPEIADGATSRGGDDHEELRERVIQFYECCKEYQSLNKIISESNTPDPALIKRREELKYFIQENQDLVSTVRENLALYNLDYGDVQNFASSSEEPQ